MLKTKIGTVLTLAGLLSAAACHDAGVPSDGAQREIVGSARGAVPSVPPPAGVGDMLVEISPQSVRSAVERLVSFGTRHTLSDVDSPARGIGAARRWIKSEFERYAADAGAEAGSAMKVYFDRHTQAPDGDRVDREVEIVNVAAELPGTLPEARERRYYVIGHYDSRASDPMDHLSDAPGANDDASGVAVVMELARVLSRHRFDSTLVFMATAGEEQGLYGAWFHAREAKERNLSIGAVLSNDIVGDPSAPSGSRHDRRVRLFSEALPAALTAEEIGKVRRLSGWSDSPSRQIARCVAEVAVWHALPVQPMLVLRRDRFLRGGDHTAFNEFGHPAVRFTVVEENYHRQHQDVRVENGVSYGDLPEFIDADYLANIARLNAAALAHLANAPSIPENARLIVARLASDTTLRWSPSPEPDVAGYEVLWRQTTSSVWQHALDVGDVTEATVPLSKDNYFFGVRAYDREGYRSPAAFPEAAEE